MKVLLLKDVYKLGRAGDVKRVADGYGRNYLLPQGMAILATPEALKMSERIREKANVQRAIINQEMDAVAKRLVGLSLAFPARASETGKLYGSVTTQMIADAINDKTGVEIARRQIDSQPLRILGEYKVPVRLTVDLIPTIDVIVYREGESIASAKAFQAASQVVDEEGEEFEEFEDIDEVDEVDEDESGDEAEGSEEPEAELDLAEPEEE